MSIRITTSYMLLCFICGICNGCGIIYKQKYFSLDENNRKWNIVIDDYGNGGIYVCERGFILISGIRIVNYANFIGPILPIIPVGLFGNYEKSAERGPLILELLLAQKEMEPYLTKSSIKILDEETLPIKVDNLKIGKTNYGKSSAMKYEYTFHLPKPETKTLQLIFGEIQNLGESCHPSPIVLTKTEKNSFVFGGFQS